MFDFKKIENIVAGIQAHMADQKKQKELELLVQTSATMMRGHQIRTSDELNIYIQRAQELILRAKQKV